MEPSRHVTSASTRAPFAAPSASERASSWRHCGGRVKASTCALVTHALAAGAGSVGAPCLRNELGCPRATRVRSQPGFPARLSGLAGGQPRQGRPPPYFCRAVASCGRARLSEKVEAANVDLQIGNSSDLPAFPPASRIGPSRSAIAASSQIQALAPLGPGSASFPRTRPESSGYRLER